MKTARLTLDPRQTCLVAIGVAVIVFAGICNYLILPAYDQWRDVRRFIADQQAQYEKLTRNLGIKQSVDEQFARLAREAIQIDSDQGTYSKFLRRLEMQARQFDVAIINTKPFDVEAAPTHNIYRVKLSVAGKIHQLLKFICGLTDGPAVVGTESLTLRAVQGINMVECTMSVWMVRLTSDNSSGKDAGPSATASRRESAGAS